jgi:hypothetical protein
MGGVWLEIKMFFCAYTTKGAKNREEFEVVKYIIQCVLPIPVSQKRTNEHTKGIYPRSSDYAKLTLVMRKLILKPHHRLASKHYFDIQIIHTQYKKFNEKGLLGVIQNCRIAITKGVIR